LTKCPSEIQNANAKLQDIVCPQILHNGHKWSYFVSVP